MSSGRYSTIHNKIAFYLLILLLFLKYSVPVHTASPKVSIPLLAFFLIFSHFDLFFGMKRKCFTAFFHRSVQFFTLPGLLTGALSITVFLHINPFFTGTLFSSFFYFVAQAWPFLHLFVFSRVRRVGVKSCASLRILRPFAAALMAARSDQMASLVR